jgi:hypothetical protein
MIFFSLPFLPPFFLPPIFSLHDPSPVLLRSPRSSLPPPSLLLPPFYPLPSSLSPRLLLTSTRYALKSVVINEVAGLTFSCNDSAIPYGNNYTDPDFRVCPFPGALPGDLVIYGDDYLVSELNYDPELQVLWIFVVVALWLLFTFCNCLAIEFLEFTGGGYTRKVYKRGKAPKAGTFFFFDFIFPFKTRNPFYIPNFYFYFW